MKRKSFKVISLLLVCILILFSGCTENLGNTEISYKTVGDTLTVKSVPNKSNVTEIVIPDTYEGLPVTSIEDFAAVNLEFVTTIKIGKNVEKIGNWAFANNQALISFTVDPENQHFCSVDGVLFTKDMQVLVAYPLAKDVTVTKDENGNEVRKSSYAIPDGVETIRTKAFYKCQTLFELTIPDSVTTIEEKAFFRCSSLNSLVLPKSIQVIGKDAFAYCSAITEVEISDTIVAIGDYAFFNCSSLKKVTVNKKEADVTLGEKWYPTNNGLNMDDLEIIWK